MEIERAEEVETGRMKEVETGRVEEVATGRAEEVATGREDVSGFKFIHVAVCATGADTPSWTSW